MENKTRGHSISRRSFVGSLISATMAGALLNSCTGRSAYKIGCYTRPWFDEEYRVALDGIAQAGFKYAGIMTDVNGRVITLDTTVEQAARIGEEIKSRGMEVASLSLGSFDVSKSLETGISQLKRYIDNTASLGAPVVHFGGTREELMDKYIEAIGECCDYAADKGVKLSLKPHGGSNTSGKDCRRYVDRIKHKNFGLWYDPGNVYYYTDGFLDPVEDAENIDNIVFGMSIKDFKMPKDVAVTPGTGMVDFPRLLSRLRKGGFTRGPLVVEGLYRGDFNFVTAEARKAREYLEQITSNL